MLSSVKRVKVAKTEQSLHATKVKSEQQNDSRSQRKQQLRQPKKDSTVKAKSEPVVVNKKATSSDAKPDRPQQNNSDLPIKRDGSGVRSTGVKVAKTEQSLHAHHNGDVASLCKKTIRTYASTIRRLTTDRDICLRLGTCPSILA